MYVNEQFLDFRKNGLVEILGSETIDSFCQLMESTPDDPFVLGILRRAGRAGFYYWLKHEGDGFEKYDGDFRFSPVKKKILNGLRYLGDLLARNMALIAELRDAEKSWEVRLTSRELVGLSPLETSYLAGFLQEFASWAGMGRHYQVLIEHTGNVSATSSHISIFKEPVE